MKTVNSFGFYSISSVRPAPARGVDYYHGRRSLSPRQISAPLASTPDVAPLTSTPDSNIHSNTLTVDEFLRRSAPKPAKRYGRGRRRVINLQNPSHSESRFTEVKENMEEQNASKRARVDTEPYTFLPHSLLQMTLNLVHTAKRFGRRNDTSPLQLG
jgi:hypothetical protein